MDADAKAAVYFPFAWTHLKEEFQGWLNEPVGAKLTPAAVGLCIGNAGVGKTTFLKEMGCAIQWMTPETCENSRDLLDQLQKYMIPSVQSQMMGEAATRVPVVIVLEDWDILIQQDRTMMGTFLQFIASERPNPWGRRILCMAQRTTEKKFPAECRRFSFKPLGETDICLLLKHRFPSLHLSAITYIAEKCQNNLHRAVEMSRFELGATATTTAAPTAKRKRAPKASPQMKSVLVLETPKEAPNPAQIFKPKSALEWFQWFSLDPWMAPLRFHENLLKEIQQRTGAKIPLYHTLLSALIDWDVSMSRWVNDEDSLWMDLPMMILSLNTSVHLESHKRLKRLKYEDADLNDFTKILSQLSLYKKNLQTQFHQYNGNQYPVYEYPYAWMYEGFA